MSHHNILIIEDNVPINRLFHKHLSAQGYRCVSVTTIQEGIEYLHSTAFDLIILDFELPDGYGTRILNEMITLGLLIPTLVISASTRVLELKHYPQYNLERILVKPVSPRHLSEVVRQSIEQQGKSFLDGNDAKI